MIFKIIQLRISFLLIIMIFCLKVNAENSVGEIKSNGEFIFKEKPTRLLKWEMRSHINTIVHNFETKKDESESKTLDVILQSSINRGWFLLFDFKVIKLIGYDQFKQPYWIVSPIKIYGEYIYGIRNIVLIKSSSVENDGIELKTNHVYRALARYNDDNEFDVFLYVSKLGVFQK